MHINIRYDGDVSDRQKRAAALRDIRGWFTHEQMTTLRQAAHEGCSRATFCMYCAIGGVQGYPVHVLYDLFLPDDA